MQTAIDETKRDLERREIEYKRIKRIQVLSDELMGLIDGCAYSEIPGILEARVKQHCPDMESLSLKIKQNCIEIRERTDDDIILGLTDSILFHLKN